MVISVPMFNTLPPQIVLQEVPGEVSLLFTITGCPVGCKGCHSPEIWDPRQGTPLDIDVLEQQLSRYTGLISCVLFFGGEWQVDCLLPLLKAAQAKGLKTCLYSGEENVSDVLMPWLDYLKLGPYRPEQGGLAQATTNQRFFDLAQGQQINHKFITS